MRILDEPPETRIDIDWQHHTLVTSQLSMMFSTLYFYRLPPILLASVQDASFLLLAGRWMDGSFRGLDLIGSSGHALLF